MNVKHRITVATTYPEAAILAIARVAADEGRLAMIYTTLRPSGWMRLLSRHGPTYKLRRGAERELKRRYLSGIPLKHIATEAEFIEVLHRGARLIPRSEAAAQRLEYIVKERFDRAVARQVSRNDSAVVVAMFASAERTLRSAKVRGQLAVLHLVNNHPRFKNQYLKELAGLHDGHHELVPSAVADRVERELELADVVLVPSRMVAMQLRSCGLPANRIIQERYAVDSWRFHPRSPDAPQSSPGGRVRCLFVGNVCRGKGIPVLLEAARRLQSRNVDFRLVGPLRSSDLLRGLPPNVRWAGSFTHNSVADEMRDADIFVLPSAEDAYPLVTMEAMACGLPVIVTDHCGTSELINNGEDGMVIPTAEVNPLVWAIEQLLDDAGLRARMGAAARRKIEAGPNWDDYGARILHRIDDHVQPIRLPAEVSAC